MTEPKNLPDLPTILVGGKEWPIPLMAPKQNRVIIPVIAKIGGAVSTGNVSQEAMDSMLNVIYVGMTRAHPELTREEFDEMELPMEDQMNAFGVVSLQTGMLAKADRSAKLEEIKAGKTKAGDGESPQTGTE